ncbi:MAG TPA: HEAT repeat domain-containing protein [bacterium]
MVPGSETAQADLAMRVLKRLSATLQDARLYTVEHPFTTKAIDLLLPIVQTYIDTHGALSVEVARAGFTLDFEGTLRRDDLITPVMFALYSRQVRRLSLLDGLIAEEVQHLLEALLTPRSAVRRLGGIGQMLWKRGVQHIALHEMIIPEEGLPVIEDEILEAVLARQNVLPESRDELRNLLLQREQSEQLFAAVVGRIRSGGTDASADSVFEALQAVDFIIAGALPRARTTMYDNLSWTIAHTAPPLGPALRALTVTRAADHPMAAEVLRAMDDRMLRGAVSEALALGGAERTVARSIALALRPHVMRVRTLLEGTPPLMGATTVREALAMATPEAATWPVHDYLPTGPSGAVLAGVTDDGVRAAALNDLVRLVRVVDLAEVHSVMLAIDRESGLLLRDGRMETLPRVAIEINRIAAERPEAADFSSWLNGLTIRELTIRLLNAMADRRDEQTWEWPYFLELRDDLTPVLLEQLEREDSLSVRRIIVSVLSRVAADRPSVLLAKLSDPRWYVVRNITGILGEIRDPATLRHLRRSLLHPEFRVRREAMRALAEWGTDDAIELLAEALTDQDLETRRAAAGWLGASRRPAAAQALLQRLRRPDVFLRDLEFRKAAVTALGGTGDRGALPFLRRLARSPLASISRRHRALAAVAQQAISALATGKTGDPA